MVSFSRALSPGRLFMNAGRPQTVTDGFGQIGLVLHEQQAHARSLDSTTYRRHMRTGHVPRARTSDQGTGASSPAHGQAAVPHLDPYGRAVVDVVGQQGASDRGLHLAGDVAAQRAGAVDGVEALARDEG